MTQRTHAMTLAATLVVGLALAFPFAFAANRYMIGRGLGHARIHQHHAPHDHAA